MEIARLLRIENAKCLHITDLVGVESRSFGEFDLFEKLVGRFDIPVEASGGIGTHEAVARLVDMGACRVVLHPGMITDAPELAAEILGAHGPSTIVASIEAGPGLTRPEDAPEVARRAAGLGFRRLLYTELDERGHVLNPPMLERLAAGTGLRVTVSGGIRSFPDLMEVQKLEKAGVDSVILRKSIYENVFACQKLWRLAEEGDYPYTAKVR